MLKKNFIHIKSKKRKQFSLLLVPPSKPIKQVKISAWIPKVVSISIITILALSSIYIVNLYTSYHTMKDDYQAKVNLINELSNIKVAQENQIKTLKKKTLEFEDKLVQIQTLQDTVKNMVGLENNREEKKEPLLSRTMSTHFEPPIDTFDNQMMEISRLLDQSQDDLTCLISDVEKRLKYLSAEPNVAPCTGRITSGFGYRKNPFGRGTEFHHGLDIANNYKTEIKAAGNGVVTYAGYNGSYGKVVIISHGYGYESIYGHNSKLCVKVGEKVEKGQVIAYMGSTGRSTGNHVHFEIRKYGKPINPYDVLNKKER
ncbi:M23 family metallopeptidase [Abyssisolibacter fermentans]|uniref:M23 family metallopeptidase n=1 Tax=Abyssisolibacter fermentans TaxID=1766203 RepID=UPI0008296742|nr:M23 family metallopeptidase [Abyssisolibacter fermentans]